MLNNCPMSRIHFANMCHQACVPKFISSNPFIKIVSPILVSSGLLDCFTECDSPRLFHRVCFMKLRSCSSFHQVCFVKSVPSKFIRIHQVGFIKFASSNCVHQVCSIKLFHQVAFTMFVSFWFASSCSFHQIYSTRFAS